MSLKVLTMGGGGASASIFIAGLDENSTVTATKGGKTVNGRWSSAESRFKISGIKSYGTWTVTATNGEKTAVQDVLVDAAMEYEIELGYKLWLYREGDQCEEITGGWTTMPSWGGATLQNDAIYFAPNASPTGLCTADMVDFSGYSTMCVDIQTTGANSSHPQIRINTVRSNANSVRSLSASVANTRHIASVDISDLNGLYYVLAFEGSMDATGSGYIYNVWLE